MDGGLSSPSPACGGFVSVCQALSRGKAVLRAGHVLGVILGCTAVS